MTSSLSFLVLHPVPAGEARFPNPFHRSGLLSGSFWLRWYPNFLGLTQRKKHFVKIDALLLNNLSSYSVFLFGRQKLNIDLWERDRGNRRRGVERKKGRGERLGRGGERRGGEGGQDRGCEFQGVYQEVSQDPSPLLTPKQASLMSKRNPLPADPLPQTPSFTGQKEGRPLL